MGKKHKKKGDKRKQRAVPALQPIVGADDQGSFFKPDGKVSRKAYEHALFDLHRQGMRHFRRARGIGFDATGARRVLAADNAIELNDGRRLGYDYLVIATGDLASSPLTSFHRFDCRPSRVYGLQLLFTTIWVPSRLAAFNSSRRGAGARMCTTSPVLL
jgi:hypothetical protein